MKKILTNYLSWIFVAFGVFMILLGMPDESPTGIGVWNLNKTIESTNWFVNPTPLNKTITWSLIYICSFVYIFIQTMGKKTHWLFSLLHILLVLSCFVFSDYWHTWGWTYPTFNVILLMLNFVYAFWGKEDVLEISDDILDV